MIKHQSFFWIIFLNQFVCILWYFTQNRILIYFNAELEKARGGDGDKENKLIV